MQKYDQVAVFEKIGIKFFFLFFQLNFSLSLLFIYSLFIYILQMA